MSLGAYVQHRYLNPSQPRAYWWDNLPMRAARVPQLRYNYPYPLVPTPGLGDVFGLGETFDYVKMAVWIFGGLAAGYFVGYLYRELRTENPRRRRSRRRNSRQRQIIVKKTVNNYEDGFTVYGYYGDSFFTGWAKAGVPVRVEVYKMSPAEADDLGVDPGRVTVSPVERRRLENAVEGAVTAKIMDVQPQFRKHPGRYR